MGGLVRATGSGMGCPDWPKCFGMYIPPTCACKLPENYEQIFLQKRIAKVEKLAGMLDKVGLSAKAAQLRATKAIYLPESFNPAKAWIEYINRIVGVLAGFAGLAFFISSFQFIKTRRRIWSWTTLGFVMLLFNAWLGSIVVATNLLPGIVTTHFLAAFLCLYFFMYALHAHDPFAVRGKNQRSSWILMFLLSMVIVLLGAWSRESIGMLEEKNILVAGGMLNIDAMGTGFVLHRYLPLLLLGTLFWFIYRSPDAVAGRQQAKWAILGIIAQMVFGMLNIFYVLPPWSQTAHIFVGSALPVLFYYMAIARSSQETPPS